MSRPASIRSNALIRSTWALPAVVAILSLIGLVSALAGDGLSDIIAWLALAVPVLAVGWAMRATKH